jgi:hypothetical protein
MVPLPAREVVDDRNGVSLAGEVESCSPTAETIASQYGDLHISSPRSMAASGRSKTAIAIRVPDTLTKLQETPTKLHFLTLTAKNPARK